MHTKISRSIPRNSVVFLVSSENSDGQYRELLHEIGDYVTVIANYNVLAEDTLLLVHLKRRYI